jgi:hypothetical protein
MVAWLATVFVSTVFVSTVAAGRSSIEVLGSSALLALTAADPGTTTEDRPLALGAGGYGMSVV